MRINIKFNIDLIKEGEVDLLYHYYNFLLYAIKNNMSLEGYSFTRSLKERTLRSMINRGWVTKDLKMKDYSTVYGCGRSFVDISEVHLKSKSNFRGFLLASTEAYALHIKNEINNGTFTRSSSDCDEYVNNSWGDDGLKLFNKTTVRVQDKKVCITGRVSNSEIKKILGISCFTIKKWRKVSKSLKLNEYDLSLVEVDNNKVSYKNHPKSRSFKTKDGKRLSYNQNITTSIEIVYDSEESEEIKIGHNIQVWATVSSQRTEGRNIKFFSRGFGDNVIQPDRRAEARARGLHWLNEIKRGGAKEEGQQTKDKTNKVDKRRVVSFGDFCS